jgi:PPM family protein phosphatase
MTKRQFTFGQVSNKGTVREDNEDAALSLVLTGATGFKGEDIGLFMVADGAGGKDIGKEASQLAIQIIAQEILKNLNGVLQEPPETSLLSDTFVSAFSKANDVFFTRGASEDWRGWATATALLIIGDCFYIAHVGDIKVYTVTQSKIEQIVSIHDFVSELIRLGHIKQEDLASAHIGKNPVYRALGAHDSIETDLLTRHISPDETLVICSDGIWKHVPDEQIREIILRYPDPQEACDQLIAIINPEYALDNMTAIVVKIGE